MAITPPSDRALYRGVSDFYERELAGWLRRQETLRRAALIGAALFGLFALLVYGYLARSLVFDWLSGALVAALGLLLARAAALAPIRSAQRRLSGGVFSRLAHFFSFAYDEAPGPPDALGAMRSLKLVGEFNEARFEDEWRGRYGGAGFCVTEAALTYRSRRHPLLTRRVFFGQLIAIETPTPLPSETVILRERGALNRANRPHRRFQPVGVGAPRFEKAFSVWGTDQVETHALLDPVMQARLEALDAYFAGEKFRVAFIGSAIYIAADGGDRFSAGSLFRAEPPERRVARALGEIDLIFDLIDALTERRAETPQRFAKAGSSRATRTRFASSRASEMNLRNRIG